jgi:hypothetical protein
MLTALVLADPALRADRQVEADLTQADRLLDLTDGVGEREGLVLRLAQEVEREPLRGALTDPGQAAELRDQAVDGRRDQGRTSLESGSAGLAHQHAAADGESRHAYPAAVTARASSGSRQAQAAQRPARAGKLVEAAARGAHALGRKLLSRADRLVGGGYDHVL